MKKQFNPGDYALVTPGFDAYHAKINDAKIIHSGSIVRVERQYTNGACHVRDTIKTNWSVNIPSRFLRKLTVQGRTPDYE